MEKSSKKCTAIYVVQCRGKSILGSVCSFAHDHAIFKMLQVLEEVDIIQNKNHNFTYNILALGKGKSDKLPVEYCEAKIEVQYSADLDAKMLKNEWTTIIKNTKCDGITFEVLDERELFE